MVNDKLSEKQIVGIRPGDIVEYRMGARMVVDATKESVFLVFDEEIKEISIDEINLLQ